MTVQYKTKALHTEVLYCDWYLLDVSRVVAINQYFETKIKTTINRRKKIIHIQIPGKLTFESRKAIGCASKASKIRLCVESA